MDILKANQTYVFKTEEYNMIDFIEFVGDEYISINAAHFFEGFLLNRIPIIKKAKLREIVTFKAAWGSISNRNNPNLNPRLIQFPVGENDRPTTRALSSRPYMEASVGVSNILKFVCADLVQRLSYLDNPDLQNFLGRNGLGIRFQVAVDF